MVDIIDMQNIRKVIWLKNNLPKVDVSRYFSNKSSETVQKDLWTNNLLECEIGFKKSASRLTLTSSDH
jgi:hypothetical protein